ncbi:MAG: hypothetical protein M0R74_10940 [Dehalococcoidia bacterium]|jgi:DNA-directed RNA polymerase subunit RPC12/RpoP|nr:hypothetical protein [Dehalococcoidia bacterium]
MRRDDKWILRIKELEAENKLLTEEIERIKDSMSWTESKALDRVYELETENKKIREDHSMLLARFDADAMLISNLAAKNKRLEAWIDDLQSEMYINCVYCGHRYGPNKGDHLVTMRKTLEKHIEECPKHPLSMARNRIMELEAENRWLREQYNSLIFEVSYKFPGESRHDTAKRYIREREEYGIEIGTKQALGEASDE